MPWSDYPYENPSLNTYMNPVIYELYLAFHERYRIAVRIGWGAWIPKPTQQEAEELLNGRFGGGNDMSSTIGVLWNLVEDCLEIYRDIAYVKLDYDASNPDNYFIYQTWMGIYAVNVLGFGNHVGYRRKQPEFIDYYESVFGEDLVYLRDWMRTRYNFTDYDSGERGKTLTLAGLFKDFYSILKNCLNEVVSTSTFGSIMWVDTNNFAGGGAGATGTIRAPYGSIGFDIDKTADNDIANPSSAQQAYDRCYTRMINNDLTFDSRSEQGMFNYGYNRFYGDLAVTENAVVTDRDGSIIKPWDARIRVAQKMVPFGNRLVDKDGSFYNYSDKELSNIHIKYGDVYGGLNMIYIGDENKVFSCPTKIENGNWLVDYTEMDGSDATDLNITTRESIQVGALQATISSRVNINEANALEYYIE